MIRCCLCRHVGARFGITLEPTALPGTGYRCPDHEACAERVRVIVGAHKGLEEMCE